MYKIKVVQRSYRLAADDRFKVTSCGLVGEGMETQKKLQRNSCLRQDYASRKNREFELESQCIYGHKISVGNELS